MRSTTPRPHAKTKPGQRRPPQTFHERIAANVLADRLSRSNATRSPRSRLQARLLACRAEHARDPDISSEIRHRAHLYNAHPWQDKRRAGVLSAPMLDKRIGLLVTIHAELHEAGYQIRNVDRLRREHAHALARHWRARLSRATAERRWIALQWWAHCCLLKPNLMGSFDQVWPAPAAGAPDASVAPAAAEACAATAAPDVCSLEPSAIPAALVEPTQPSVEAVAAMLAAEDEKALWIWRLTQALGLTVIEAARLDLLACSALPGSLMTPRRRGRPGRLVRLDTPHRQQLVEHLRRWAIEHHPHEREPLRWFDRDDTQIKARFAYLLGKARKAAAAAEAAAAATAPAATPLFGVDAGTGSQAADLAGAAS